MLKAFINVFRIPDLRNKLLFTIGMLVIYRIGYWIPLPGVDQSALKDLFTDTNSAAGKLATYVATFSGGALHQSTIFGLGVMPYISASIIIQLLTTAYPALKKLQQEGPAGRQKINEYTRYATLALCLVQGLGWLIYIQRMGLIYPSITNNDVSLWAFRMQGVVALTAGSFFLMWLGEQIDRYGMGNGMSLIIAAGIISRMPAAVMDVARDFSMTQGGDSTFKPQHVTFLIACFVGVTAGAVLMTVAQRRIPIHQAKTTRGRNVYGGSKAYIPLRVNHSGVMPIVFAQSLMIFPQVIFSSLAEMSRDSSMVWWHNSMQFMSDNFSHGKYLNVVAEIVLIYFFAYFWTTVQFNPEDMSDQLRKSGSFIPGLRPGPRTAEYLETVLERITYVGAGFLSVIAIIPTVMATAMGIPWAVSSFLGGTGLLIVVSVGLDLIQRIEANLLMRNYPGFLSASTASRRGNTSSQRANLMPS